MQPFFICPYVACSGLVKLLQILSVPEMLMIGSKTVILKQNLIMTKMQEGLAYFVPTCSKSRRNTVKGTKSAFNGGSLPPARQWLSRSLFRSRSSKGECSAIRFKLVTWIYEAKLSWEELVTRAWYDFFRAHGKILLSFLCEAGLWELGMRCTDILCFGTELYTLV